MSNFDGKILNDRKKKKKNNYHNKNHQKILKFHEHSQNQILTYRCQILMKNEFLRITKKLS